MENIDTKSIIEICKRYGIVMVAVFGSFSRNEQTKSSDIDLLVQFSEPKSLMEHVKLQNEIADRIGIEVDLVTESSLSPYIKKQVLIEKKVIYEAA